MGRMTPLMDCVNHNPASSTVAVNAEFRRPQPWRADFPEGFGLAYVADRDYSPVSASHGLESAVVIASI
jgi:hypothetical protein